MDVLRADNFVKKKDDLAIFKQISTNAMQCTYQVWWKYIDIHLSYHP